MIKIYQALLKAQKEITFAIKDKKNPHFKSTYATLESVIDAVKTPLNNAGVFICHTINKEGLLTTSLIHADSGESITSDFQVPQNASPQQIGSAQTYGKRYNLTALLSLPTEDDDGNHASQAQQHKQQPQSATNSLLNYGDYVINFSKKFKGKKLSEVTDKEHQSMIDWLLSESKKSGKDPVGSAKEYLEMAMIYLNEKQPKELDLNEVLN